MTRRPDLTQDQLNEIKHLAKSKTLKEIGCHFNMSKAQFQLFRKQQPEINAIYYGTTKDKVRTEYTPEELIEIEKMLATSNSVSLAKHLGISMSVLRQARTDHPELDSAIVRGINNRPSDFNLLMRIQRKKAKEEQLNSPEETKKDESKKVTQTKNIKIKKSDSLFTRAPDDISPEDAIERFQRLKRQDKQQRLLQELKETDM